MDDLTDAMGSTGMNGPDTYRVDYSTGEAKCLGCGSTTPSSFIADEMRHFGACPNASKRCTNCRIFNPNLPTYNQVMSRENQRMYGSRQYGGKSRRRRRHSRSRRHRRTRTRRSRRHY